MSRLREGTDSVRTFLTKASTLRTDAAIGDATGSTAKIAAALDKVEAAQGGKPLLFSDAKGMAAFKKEARRRRRRPRRANASCAGRPAHVCFAATRPPVGTPSRDAEGARGRRARSWMGSRRAWALARR